MDKITVSIDLSKAQSAFQHNELVYVIDKTDGNYGYYGTIANQTALPHNLREDWREKLAQNKPFDREYFIVNFGGHGSDRWSSLYHKSQIINVRLLGQLVLEQSRAGNE
jgi:hypothetical protein